MTSIVLDRQGSIAEHVLSRKGPCRAASTGPLTLSGLQTVDGVALVDNDRVLVKDQVNQVQNGIYLVKSSDWERTADFNRNDDVRRGAKIFVVEGTVNALSDWHVVSADGTFPGREAISFGEIPDMSAADLLTQIKTVDGAGSGLDADLLDGNSSAHYATAASVTTVSSDLAAHIADTSDAHDASAISVAPSGSLAATDVQAGLVEILGDVEAHVADTTAAHAASAISFTPNGSIAATDVQAAIQEVRDEAGASGGITTIASGSLSGAAISITSIPETYAHLILHVAGASSDTATRQPLVRVDTDNGASYDATAGNYEGTIYPRSTFALAATTLASLVESATQAAANTWTFTIWMFGYHTGPFMKWYARITTATETYIIDGAYIGGGGNNIDAIQILWNGTGNFDAGTYALYGVS